MHAGAPRSTQAHPGDTREAFKSTQKHPGGTQQQPGATQQQPGGTQNVSRSTQEAPRTTQETPRRHPGDTQGTPRGTRRHQGPPKRHQGDTQGTPKGHPEAPRAPEAILIENQPKPLSFTVKMAAGTYFVREWRRRHAPFPQPAHKNESTQCAPGAPNPARPLYQHRKNPYR